MKSYVICHMIMSLDGRIVSSRWELSPEGRAEYENTAAIYRADAWICGRITMAGFARGAAPASDSSSPSVPLTDFIAPHEERSYAIALDPGGKLNWGRREISGDHIITVLTEKVDGNYLDALRADGVSYLFGGADRIDLPRVLAKLADQFQIKTLLLEGGGKINGSMIAAGVIDELSLLIAPAVDGASGTPALFDIVDAELPRGSRARWKLHSMERRADDIIWLRYKRAAI